MPRKASLSALAVPVVLFCAAAVFTLLYVGRGNLDHFYQEEFAPAVALACTGKFVAPQLPVPALEPFLLQRTPSFDCADLAAIVPAPLDIWQRQHLYLILAAGLIWWLVGVSWPALAAVSALLAGGFIVAVYCIARLLLTTPWAAAVAVAAALSPYHLRMLPQVRDYSKATFIVVAIWFACRLALPDAAPWKSIRTGLIAGVIVGVGMGFRPDLTMAIPFLLAVLPVVLIATRLKTWRHVACATIAFACAFVLASAPILGTYQKGGVLGFAALNGLMLPFTQELGLEPPIYDLGHLFLDNHIGFLVHGYAVKFAPAGVWPDLGAQYPHFNGYAVGEFLEYVRHFPADMVVRGYASVLKVLNTHTRDFALTVASPGLWLVLIALAVMAAERPVLAIVWISAVGYFCGLSAIQFHPRHFFHLEFFVWISLALVIVTGIALRRRETSIARLRSGVWLPLGAVATAALLLVSLRAYQQQEATRLIAGYTGVQTEALTLREETGVTDTVLRLDDPVPDMTGAATRINETRPRGYYLKAVLDERACPNRSVELTVLYERDQEDLSRKIVVPLSDSSTASVFFPVFVDDFHRFRGVGIASDRRACLLRVDAVTNYRSLPLPLWLRLPSNWRERTLYQTFAQWGPRGPRDE